MAFVWDAYLARVIRLLGRCLRVPVAAVVTEKRVLARGLRPDQACGLTDLLGLVPVNGLVSISNLAVMPYWGRTFLIEGDLRFMAGVAVMMPDGARAALMVLDTRLRGPLTKVERSVLEDFAGLTVGLLGGVREPEPERQPDAPGLTEGVSARLGRANRRGHGVQGDGVQSDELDRRLEDSGAAIKLEEARTEAMTQERLRIAREMHDGLGKELFGLAMLLESVAESQTGRAVQDELLNHAGTARRLGNEARALVRGFREASSSGFAQRVRAIVHAQTQRADGPQAHISLPEHLPELDQVAVHELSRVIQEAFENVRRHARARNAWVTVSLHGSSLMVRIDDDGRGFTGSSVRGRYGVLGMRERVELLGGRLVLEPSPRGGVRLEARVPLTPIKEPDASRA